VPGQPAPGFSCSCRHRRSTPPGSRFSAAWSSRLGGVNGRRATSCVRPRALRVRPRPDPAAPPRPPGTASTSVPRNRLRRVISRRWARNGHMWLCRARRLLGLLGATRYLPAPIGFHTTPTIPESAAAPPSGPAYDGEQFAVAVADLRKAISKLGVMAKAKVVMRGHSQRSNRPAGTPVVGGSPGVRRVRSENSVPLPSHRVGSISALWMSPAFPNREGWNARTSS
jgi:hypothetical protein